MTDFNALLSGVPLIENPLFSSFVDSLGFEPETKRIAMDLHLKGYAVIKCPDLEFDMVAERIKQTLASQFDFDGWRQHGWMNTQVCEFKMLGRVVPMSVGWRLMSMF